MPSQLGKNLEAALSELDLSQHIPLTDVIPTSPQTFYEKLGYLRHPRTNEVVTQLAPYQIDVWNGLLQHKRVLTVKSNKVGLTTSSLMMDLQLALLPSSNPLSTKGYDTLVLAQTKDMAREHLRTLRKMIIDSTHYSKYLIDSPSEIPEYDIDDSSMVARKLLRDDQTKTNVIFLRNSENERKPSRIIALGLSNSGSILSWKSVKNIHISDPTAMEGDVGPSIEAAMTRLANTNGSCIIETIPSPPSGKIYDMWNQFSGKEWQSGDFKTYTITADDAVKAGVITQDHLDAEKRQLGVMYERYYGAKFVAGAGNIFESYLLEACIQDYPLHVGDGRKVLAVDPGFGSSKFAIVGVEMIDGIAYVREAKQFERPHASAMLELISAIYHRDGYTACYVDSSRPELVEELRKGSEATGRKPVRADPIVFRESLGEMVMNAISMVRELKVRIHPSFRELIYQLKAVSYDEAGKPDKKRLSFDLGDAILMSLFKAAHKDIHAVLLKKRRGERYY